MPPSKPIIRCSGLSNTLRCPGAPHLTRRVKDVDYDATLGGLWCHEEASKILLAAGAITYAEPEQRIDGFEPDKFIRWIPRYFAEEVLDALDGGWAILCEGGFSQEFDRFILSGHIDVLALWVEGPGEPPIKAKFWDLKSGRVPVPPAPINEQVEGYFSQVYDAYPSLLEIEGNITQPLNNEDAGFDRTTTRFLTWKDLNKLTKEVEQKINESLDSPYLLRTGWRQCQYCNASLICPALRKDMELELTEEMLAEIKGEPSINRLAEIKLLDKKYATTLEKAGKMLKARLTPGEPIEIGGVKFSVTVRNGRKTITNNFEATQQLLDLPDDVFYELFTFKIRAIEDALAKHLDIPRSSKKVHDSKKEFESRIGHLIEQGTMQILNIG